MSAKRERTLGSKHEPSWEARLATPVIAKGNKAEAFRSDLIFAASLCGKFGRCLLVMRLRRGKANGIYSTKFLIVEIFRARLAASSGSDPGVTEGCWTCLEYAHQDGTIPRPPRKSSEDTQPAGCGSPTFEAASFDVESIALIAVRLAISTLCSVCPDGYPTIDWDALRIQFLNRSASRLELSEIK